ncbi:MAG: 30S ribosomal protein S6 [Bacteroidota bacterium]
MERKNYETIFILTPVLSQEQVQESIKKYQDLLKKREAEIIHEENMGLKKLAYLVQQKSTGIYYLIEFSASPSAIADLEVEYRRDEKVIRFMTVTLDQHGVTFNEKKRNGTLADKPELKTEVA